MFYFFNNHRMSSNVKFSAFDDLIGFFKSYANNGRTERRVETRKIQIVPDTPQVPNQNRNMGNSSSNTRSSYRLTSINEVFISRDEAIRKYGKRAKSNIFHLNKDISPVPRKMSGKVKLVPGFENYNNSNSTYMGRPIQSFSEEELSFLREKSKREQAIAYERKVNEIIASIPNNLSQKGKLRAVFDWFVKNTTYYEYYPGYKDGRAHGEYVEWNSYPPEISFLDYSGKEGAILTGCSVCRGLSQAYKDVVNRLGISCDTVRNSMHEWNVVYGRDREYYIDIAQAVRLKNKLTGEIKTRQHKNSNFLVSLEELDRGPYNHQNGTIDFVMPKFEHITLESRRSK